MKKLLAVLLCLCLVLGFAACTKEKEETDGKTPKASEKAPTASPIEGVWESEVDTLGSFGLDEEDMAAYEEFDFTVKMIYEFKADGKYTLKTESDGIYDGLYAIYKLEILPEMAEALECSYEELIADSGMEEEEYISFMVDAAIEALETVEEGSYKYEEGKLYLVFEGEELNPDTYYSCTLANGSLKITGAFFEGEPDELSELVGVEFKKAN